MTAEQRVSGSCLRDPDTLFNYVEVVALWLVRSLVRPGSRRPGLKAWLAVGSTSVAPSSPAPLSLFALAFENQKVTQASMA